MNKFLLRIVYDRKGETKDNPQLKALVHIKIVEKATRKKRYISTGIKLGANQYSPQGGFSIKSHPNAMILKAKVLDMYNKVEAYINSDKCNYFDDIYNWDKETDTKVNFLSYFEEELKKKKLATNSWCNHRTLYSSLVKFGKIVNLSSV